MTTKYTIDLSGLEFEKVNGFVGVYAASDSEGERIATVEFDPTWAACGGIEPIKPLPSELPVGSVVVYVDNLGEETTLIRARHGFLDLSGDWHDSDIFDRLPENQSITVAYTPEGDS